MSEKYCQTYRPFLVALGRILTALPPDLTLLDVALGTLLALAPVSTLEGFVGSSGSGSRGGGKVTFAAAKASVELINVIST
jgi:hypothetical protein